MFGPFPIARPSGLRRGRVDAGTRLWRIDSDPASRWSWSGFPAPLHRFDPRSGAFRVRYAAHSVHGAARERYVDSGRFIPADHLGHRLVQLTAQRTLNVLDLRREAALDALGVDDRISTSHDPIVWDACHRLTDAARGWWPDLDGIVYRSRTTPASSVNVAFFSLDGFHAASRMLRRCTTELDDLVVSHQFTIGFEY